MQILQKLSETGATARQIEIVETMLGAPLPEDYRKFLIDTNGGRPTPCNFEGPSGDGSVVNWFFTLNEEKQIYFLPSVFEVYKDRIPPKLLPIASDPFGNLVLLDMGNRSRNAIYFWEHEGEYFDGEPWWDNISYIAASFSEFVDLLL